MDIKQEQLNSWTDNGFFNPQKLDYHDVDSKTMKDAAVKCLEHIAAVSNRNLMRNADGLLCRKDVDVNVEWVGGGNRATPS